MIIDRRGVRVATGHEFMVRDRVGLNHTSRVDYQNRSSTRQVIGVQAVNRFGNSRGNASAYRLHVTLDRNPVEWKAETATPVTVAVLDAYGRLPPDTLVQVFNQFGGRIAEVDPLPETGVYTFRLLPGFNRIWANAHGSTNPREKWIDVTQDATTVEIRLNPEVETVPYVP